MQVKDNLTKFSFGNKVAGSPPALTLKATVPVSLGTLV